ncbi:two-component regulator propeller domain-containing protein [Bacteroidota bacterium]
MNWKLGLICIILFGILITCTKDELNTDPPNTIKITISEQSNASFIGIRVNSISIDQFDQVWFATDIGLYNYKDGIFYKLEMNGIDKINDVYYYNSEIIVSTNKGVVLIDNINGSILEKSIQLNIEYSDIMSDTINTSYINDRNVYWFGTVKGPCLLNDTVWTDTLDKNVKDINVTSFTNRGTDYFAGTFGSYLFHFYYDNDVDAVTRASKMEIGYNGNLTSDTIYDVYVSSDDYLWFGSSLGLTKQKGQTKSWTGEFYYFLHGEHVLSIIEDNNLSIWAGSNNGVWHQIDTTWHNITIEDGLSGSSVYSIAVDKNNKVWIGTNNGISCIIDEIIENY